MDKAYPSVTVTKHSVQRTKERIGLRKGQAEKNAQKALSRGLTHAETTGALKKYLNALYLSRGTANNMRVYHRYVYIFHDITLITIFPLPRNLHKLADKLQREKDGKEAEK